MTQKMNDEPGDEFDRITIPAFLARPFEALGNLPRPTAPAARTDDSSPAAPRFPGAPGSADADSADDEQPAPRSWWAGNRGKLLLYGVGTVVMIVMQSQR